ncbi:hypothetical protein SB775_02750 [Peribacillus sp. SIMBA_075]
MVDTNGFYSFQWSIVCCSAVLFSSFPSVPAYVRAFNLLTIATNIDIVEDIKYEKVNAPLSNEK